ncbi:MAG: carbonic anhydrase [Thiotrichales bacterium]|nr:carbonic anhydrase [Thiotrichales bacterium]
MSHIQVLLDGFQRFRKKYFEEQPELYHQLVTQEQSPKSTVITCCDSRVNPAQILDVEPGDIFVVRNVANLVPPCDDDGKTHGTSAALEFSIKHLQVQHVVIVGHGQCGGIKSLMEGSHDSKDYQFIDPWMQIAIPAREKVLQENPQADFTDQCRLCESESIRMSMQNLLTFPWIKQRVDAGELQAQ